MPFIKLQVQITAVCGHVLNCFSHIHLFVTLWVVACQAPLSMGFSKQDYWNGLLFPPPGDLPNPGTEPASLMSLALAGGFFTTSNIWEAWEACGQYMLIEGSVLSVEC